MDGIKLLLLIFAIYTIIAIFLIKMLCKASKSVREETKEFIHIPERKIEYYSNESLVVEKDIVEDTLYLFLKGESNQFSPSKYLTPLFMESISFCELNNKNLVIDFEYLTYMNSSTITPLLKFLNEQKDSKIQITIIYDDSKKWQELCFSALKAMETDNIKIYNNSSDEAQKC